MSPRAHLLLRLAAIAVIVATWLSPRGASSARAQASRAEAAESHTPLTPVLHDGHAVRDRRHTAELAER